MRVGENEMKSSVTSEQTQQIRLATIEDVPRILEIYSYYVEETNVSFEYVAPTIEEFTQRYLDIIAKYPYLVMEVNDIVVGYAYATTFKGRMAYSWDVEATIYFHKDCKGGGKGRALYTELERYLKQQNIVNLYACVTHPYCESVIFHEKMGYEKVAHFHKCGYKFNKWHDMVWLAKSIGEHTDTMKDVIWFRDLQI